jgi:predicted DNA-binding ribbon-helix-helix protein
MNTFKIGVISTTRIKSAAPISRERYSNRLDEDGLMKSSVVKRSVVIDGHKTSVSLEDTFWDHLKEIARAQHGTLSKLIAEIDETRQYNNLSSAIRVFVFEHFRAAATAAGKPLSVEDSDRNESLDDRTRGPRKQSRAGIVRKNDTGGPR